MTGEQAQEARRKLNLDQWGMAKLLGVGLRTVFRWEAEGVPPGPARLVYDLVLQEELPARYVPQEDAQGRCYPTAR